MKGWNLPTYLEMHGQQNVKVLHSIAQCVFCISFYWNTPREAVKSTESFDLLHSAGYRNIVLAFYIKIIKILLKCVTSRQQI